MSQAKPQPQPVIRHTRVRQAWTAKEEAYLRQRYRTRTAEWIAAKLKRPYQSVTSKAQALGLHKRIFACESPSTGEFYSAGAVAQGLSVPETTVRRWIKSGKLAMHAQWISGEEVARFLRTWPAEVDVAGLPAEQRRWAQALIGEAAEKRKGRAG